MPADHVQAFVRALHACWPTGDLDRLNAFYHPEVVLLPPDLGEPIHGREAVVASYGEFLTNARLLDFSIEELRIFSYAGPGDSALHMAHLVFQVRYRLDSDEFHERGLELYTIGEADGGLSILWRQQSVLESRIVSDSGGP